MNDEDSRPMLYLVVFAIFIGCAAAQSAYDNTVIWLKSVGRRLKYGG